MRAEYCIVRGRDGDKAFTLMSICPTSFGSLPALNFVATSDDEGELYSIKRRLEGNQK